MCLLAQIHPLLSKDSEELSSMYLHHAHMVCGITAHVKDRGVASVAIRSLAIAGDGLVERREQEEVLEIFTKIQKETGWRIAALTKELKAKWRWADEVQMMAQPNSLAQFFPAQTQGPATNLPPAPPQPPRTIPSGILNTILSKADFSLPNHPYQSHYQPPNQQHHHSSHMTFM